MKATVGGGGGEKKSVNCIQDADFNIKATLEQIEFFKIWEIPKTAKEREIAVLGSHCDPQA